MQKAGLWACILTGLLACNGWADEAKKTAKTEPTLMADANGDGVTDGLDQIIWAQFNGTTTTDGVAAGDFNLDGTVDGLDYLVWSSEYTSGAPPPTSPEPDPLPGPLPSGSRLDGWDIKTQGVPLPETPAELVSTLSMLPRLQKVHWSWPWDKRLLVNTPLAYQVARINRSVGLSVARTTPSQVRQAVAVCESTGARLSLQYSPWHGPYEDAHGGDPRHWGEAHHAEVDLMQSKVDAIARILGSDTERVAIFELDQENLRDDYDANGRPDPARGRRPDQTAALQVKNDIAYTIAKRAFPEARILWHSHGGKDRHHAPDQKHDGLACTEFYNNSGGPQLYRANAIEFVATAEAAGFTEFIPATSLAGFYGVRVSLPDPGYVKNEPYPVRLSWRKGRDSNHPYFSSERFEERYGPTWKIQAFYWWPAPFGTNPDGTYAHAGYDKHFVAYVAGAANLKASEGDWLDNLEE